MRRCPQDRRSSSRAFRAQEHQGPIQRPCHSAWALQGDKAGGGQAHRGGMCPGMSCRTRCQRACLWPPALPRACWDTLAESHWPPPALAPTGPGIRDGPARSRVSQHCWELCSPDHLRAGWRQLHGCPSIAPARAPGPGLALCPPSCCTWAPRRGGGGPAEPRYCPTRAAVFLHFADREEQLRLHREALGEQQSVMAEARLRRTWVPLLSPPFSLCPRSLAGIRPAASRLVPWPSPPRTLPASPWVGAGCLHQGFVGGRGGERGFSSGAILTEVGVTPPPPESLVHTVSLNGRGRAARFTQDQRLPRCGHGPRTSPGHTRCATGWGQVSTPSGRPGRHTALGACPSPPAFCRLALHPEPVGLTVPQARHLQGRRGTVALGP